MMGAGPLTPRCLHKAFVRFSVLLLNVLAIWNLVWLAAKVAEGCAFGSGGREEMRGSCSLFTYWPCCFLKRSGLWGHAPRLRRGL